MFSRRPKANIHFRTRLEEHALTLDNKSILNVGIGSETVIFYHQSGVLEVYKKDAVKIIDELLAGLQSINTTLKE